MTTEEIIRRLGEIKAVYPAALGNAIGEAETAADLKALTAAIQAVTALEEIKKELRGRCQACKHHAAERTDFPCYVCSPTHNDYYNYWEWRWPLGEDTTT